MFKKKLLSALISLTFSISIISGLGINSFIVSAFTEQGEIISNVVYPIKTIDEFIPSTTTIDENFMDNMMIVVAFWAFYGYNFLHETSSFHVDCFLAETLYHERLDVSIFI